MEYPHEGGPKSFPTAGFVSYTDGWRVSGNYNDHSSSVCIRVKRGIDGVSFCSKQFFIQDRYQ
jgi:hypothetical protein